MTPYANELNVITQAMKKAYLTHGHFSTVKEKARFDPVTDADLNIEVFLKEAITQAFPQDAILGEETASTTAIEGRTWTVDPIDGTANFAKGIPLFGIQCALFEGGVPVVSAIYLPNFDEMYTAIRDRGAFCNGVALKVVPSPVERSVVSFGDFSHARPDDFTDQHRMQYLASTHVAKIRMFGSAAVDFCALAAGGLDGVVLFTKNQWDLAPGMLLAREAGAVITDPAGEPYTLGSSRGVTATASQELSDRLKSCF